MTDPWNGYAFKVTSPDMNSPGVKRHRQLLVVARNMQEASEIAQRMTPGAIFEGSGPEILAKARKIGVGDNDARLYDPSA